MGMYDEVKCDGDLPDGHKSESGVFQTKDFGRTLDQFEIVGNRLIYRKTCDNTMEQFKPDSVIHFHGMLNFYHYDAELGRMYEYMAKFTDGLLVEVMTYGQYIDQMLGISGGED